MLQYQLRAWVVKTAAKPGPDKMTATTLHLDNPVLINAAQPRVDDGNARTIRLVSDRSRVSGPCQRIRAIGLQYWAVCNVGRSIFDDSAKTIYPLHNIYPFHHNR